MKGIIFNLVEEIISQDYGIETWEDLLDQSGVPGAYSAVASYPDEQLFTIIDIACAMTGKSQQELLRYVGRRSIPLLQQRYPEFFVLHSDSRSFLGSLNEVIHPEVRKLYTGAEPPHFEFADEADGSLVMEYHSHRSMCAFGEGLILGAGDSYGDQLRVSQLECKLNGAPFCVLRVEFA